MTMTSQKCSGFRTVTSKQPCCTFPVWDLVTTSSFENIVTKYRNGLIEKRSLPAFTPSGVFRERCADALIEPSNVICIDIDGKDNPSVSYTTTMKRLVSQLPFVWYCGISVSGNGVFCLVKYEDHKLHKQYFKALEKDFSDIGLTIDKACSDICRLRIVSYDSNPYINENPTIYNKMIQLDSDMNEKHTQQTVVMQKTYTMEQCLISPLECSGMSAAVSAVSSTNRIIAIIDRILDLEIDITQRYEDWYCIGCVIRSIFGDAGRNTFHQISQFYPNYSHEECDSKYDSILKSKHHYRYDRMIDIATKYGVV